MSLSLGNLPRSLPGIIDSPLILPSSVNKVLPQLAPGNFVGRRNLPSRNFIDEYSLPSNVEIISQECAFPGAIRDVLRISSNGLVPQFDTCTGFFTGFKFFCEVDQVNYHHIKPESTFDRGFKASDTFVPLGFEGLILNKHDVLNGIPLDCNFHNNFIHTYDWQDKLKKEYNDLISRRKTNISLDQYIRNAQMAGQIAWWEDKFTNQMFMVTVLNLYFMFQEPSNWKKYHKDIKDSLRNQQNRVLQAYEIIEANCPDFINKYFEAKDEVLGNWGGPGEQ